MPSGNILCCELYHHQFRWQFAICSAPKQHLNQCWLNEVTVITAICTCTKEFILVKKKFQQHRPQNIHVYQMNYQSNNSNMHYDKNCNWKWFQTIAINWMFMNANSIIVSFFSLTQPANFNKFHQLRSGFQCFKLMVTQELDWAYEICPWASKIKIHCTGRLNKGGNFQEPDFTYFTNQVKPKNSDAWFLNCKIIS